MDTFVIFSKPLVWVLITLIVAAYVGDAVTDRLIPRFRARTEKLKEEAPLGEEYALSLVELGKLQLLRSVIAVTNMLVHFGEFIYMLFIKATLPEMLFMLMISVALALTVSRIRKWEV